MTRDQQLINLARSTPVEEDLLDKKEKPYKIVLHFEDEDYEESFGSKEAARAFIQDQYDNWYADDEDVAENIIFPILTRVQEDD